MDAQPISTGLSLRIYFLCEEWGFLCSFVCLVSWSVSGGFFPPSSDDPPTVLCHQQGALIVDRRWPLIGWLASEFLLGGVLSNAASEDLVVHTVIKVRHCPQLSQHKQKKHESVWQPAALG